MAKLHQRGDRKAARFTDQYVQLAGVTYVVPAAISLRDWWARRGIVRLAVERVPAPPAGRYGPATKEPWYECHVEIGGSWRASGEGDSPASAIRQMRTCLKVMR